MPYQIDSPEDDEGEGTAVAGYVGSAVPELIFPPAATTRCLMRRKWEMAEAGRSVDTLDADPVTDSASAEVNTHWWS